MTHISHTLFKPEDFTDEEIARRNLLSIAVMEDGLHVCKVCGRWGRSIKESCQYVQQARQWKVRGYLNEVTK